MITRKKTKLGLKAMFFFLYALVFFLFLFFLPKVLKFYFNTNQVLSPLGSDIVSVSNSKSDKFYNDLIKSLKSKHITFISVSKLSDSSYKVILTNNKEVIFEGRLKVDKQVSSLQLIQNRLTIEGKDFKKLDFRFSNPVIVLK